MARPLIARARWSDRLPPHPVSAGRYRTSGSFVSDTAAPRSQNAVGELVYVARSTTIAGPSLVTVPAKSTGPASDRPAHTSYRLCLCIRSISSSYIASASVGLRWIAALAQCFR